MPVGRLQEVVIDCGDPQRLATIWQDCGDPQRLATFWQQVLGGEIRVESDEWVLVATPDGGTSVSFQRVPEPKVGKNRVHLDVRVGDLAAATEAAETFGAVRLGPVRHDELGGFQVMTDPEGNEFCLVEGDTPPTA